MTEHVIVSEKNGIVRFELNRPEKLNSVDEIMARELNAGCERVEKVDGARCVIISGRGKAFCAGADLGAAKDKPADYWVRTVSDTLQRIQAMPCPVITAVHGYALGLGAGMALTGDFVIAADNTTMGFPEVHHGLVPGVIAAVLRPIVSDRELSELLFFGNKMTATEAQGYGLINKIVPAEQLESAALELAGRLMERSPTALRLTKKLIQEMKSMKPAEIYRAAEAAVLIGRETEDAKEGMAAFRERRKPVWTGK